jgi:hypothetical protein
MDFKKIFTEQKDSLIVAAPYIEVMIPESYFQDGIAEWVGDRIRTLFIFEFTVFPSRESAGKGTRKLLAMPIESMLSFQDKYTTGSGETAVHVFQMERGDVFLENLNVTKSVDAGKKFIQLLHGGNLPASIPYERVMKLYNDCMEINGINLEVPNSVLESIVAELYRDASNLNVPYRRSNGKAYKAVNLKRLPALSSNFAALSFEDMNQSVIASVARTKSGAKEVASPIERTLHY